MESQSLRDFYNQMLGAYQNNKDKKQAARNALLFYEENLDEIEEARAALADIDNLVDVLRESLNIISEKKGAKVQIRRGTTVSKLIPCGKSCGGCPHGPYLYKVYRKNGKLVWKYLGTAKQSQVETEECQT